MQKFDFRALYLAAMLICCGLLSPSNGLDEAVNLSHSTALSISFGLLITTLLVYVFVNLVPEKNSHNNQTNK